MEGTPRRRRVRPSERFEGTQRLIDLDRAFASLPAESVARQGHIQKTIYRHGATTTAIFQFQAGAGLEEYELEGQAIIQVVSGTLRVCASDRTYEVGPNHVLLLDPGVAQELRAITATRMLLTIVLEQGASDEEVSR